MTQASASKPEEPGVSSPSAYKDKSVGELVALATSNVATLLKSEIELAKIELKADAKRAGLGSALFVIVAFIACLVLVLLSISAAYGLVELLGGGWQWLAFLIVAGVYCLLAGLLVFIGIRRMKKISGLPTTRKTLSEDIAMLRGSRDSGGEPPAITE